jgi:hypothetical protein
MGRIKITPEIRKILNDQREEKLDRLCELEGKTREALGMQVFNSVVDAICLTPGCDSTYRTEPDLRKGHCEECGFNNVESGISLLGMI